MYSSLVSNHLLCELPHGWAKVVTSSTAMSPAYPDPTTPSNPTYQIFSYTVKYNSNLSRISKSYWSDFDIFYQQTSLSHLIVSVHLRNSHLGKHPLVALVEAFCPDCLGSIELNRFDKNIQRSNVWSIHVVKELEAQRRTARDLGTQNTGLVSTAARGTGLNVDVFTYIYPKMTILQYFGNLSTNIQGNW